MSGHVLRWGDWQQHMIKWTNNCKTFIWIVICHKPFIHLRFIFLHHNKYYFLASGRLAAEKDLHYTIPLSTFYICCRTLFYPIASLSWDWTACFPSRSQVWRQSCINNLSSLTAGCVDHCAGPRILLWQRLRLYCGHWGSGPWWTQCLN